MPIPEVADPTIECPSPALWQCFDAQTAEVEILEFLYALTRTLKPQLIVETGSHQGISACYMAKALRDNGRGKLVTCEVDYRRVRQTRAMFAKARLEHFAECREQSSLDLVVDGDIELLFLDSLPELRMTELAHFWGQLTPQSLVVIHDVNSGFHNPLRQQVLRLDKDRKLSIVLLSTPRGIALGQKREERT